MVEHQNVSTYIDCECVWLVCVTDSQTCSNVSNICQPERTHSQLFCGSSKSCVVNFAFFAWNPFNLPRVAGWYHWNPQNRPKGALFRGYRKSRIFFLNQ